MEPIENIEEIIRKKLNATPDPALHDRMLARVRQAWTQNEETTPAPNEPVLRRPIMKNPITKLAVAAAIIAAVVLGLFEFISTDSGSAVVWAEVAQRVEASRGVIYRSRGDTSRSKYAEQAESGHTTVYLSPTQSRSDGFRNGKPWMTMYGNSKTGQGVVLLHEHKEYAIENKTPADEDDPKHADHHDPRWWVRKFMAHPHTQLEPTEIEGTLCEGIETRDTALMGDVPYRIDSFCARLWVSIETGYPVQVEYEFTGEYSFYEINDQFQWDVELEAEMFEPNIPADYELM